MKTITKTLWTLTIASLFMLIACSKDDDKSQPDETPVGDITYKNVNVVIPEGSTLTHSDLKVIGSLEENEITGNGTSKIPHIEGERTLAVAVNTQNEPVMLGFIRDGKTEISLASTLEAAYYFGLGTMLLQEPIRDEYFKQSASLKSFDETLAELETKFESDPNFINTQGFMDWMSEKLELIRNDDDEITVYRSIEADANDIRSGLQVFEDDGTSIKIANEYRRRARAFFYKTAIKKTEQPEETLIEKVADYDTPTDKTATISPTQAKREVTGIIGDAASGVGVKFSRTETDPVPLELNDNEDYSIYKVRVVGASLRVPNSKLFNQPELQAYQDITFETLTMDWILPMFLDFIGEAKLLDGLDESYFKGLTATIKAGASSVPGMTEAIAKGDLQGAFQAFLNGFYGNTISEQRKDFIEAFREAVLNYKSAIGNKNNISALDNTQSAVDKFKNLNKILDWTDRLLKLADYAAIVKDLGNSKPLEEWTVKAKQDPVILTPKEPVAFPYIKEYIKAEVKNTELASGQHFKYQWQVSGTYGTLNDDLGHSGPSFDSSSEEVYYLTKLNDDEVPEDATETIICKVYVEAGQQSNLVGIDTLQLKVKSYKYKIRPDGATIEGNTTLNLKILRPDFSQDITSNPSLDYRIDWSTSGTYGEFKNGGTFVSVFNSNSIHYKALDEDVEEGVETVNARIYGKLKEEPDSGYELYDEVEAKIYIKNDDKKIYKIIPLVREQWGPTVTGAYTNCGAFMVFKVPPIENAVRYELKVIEYSINNSFLGRTDSWTPTSRQTEDDGYYYSLNGVAAYSAQSTPTHLYNGCKAWGNLANVSGAAQVTITLE